MRYTQFKILPIFWLLCLCGVSTVIQASAHKGTSVTLTGEVNASTSRLLTGAIQQAEKQKADFLLIRMNTYGGQVSDADEIRSALLKTAIPCVVWIEYNAASAGALIALACDSILMKSGSTIGAATVVNGQGEVMPEKYQSYMRKKMRATAEITGRNPEMAEGMTDEDLEIPGIKQKGKVLTLSTKEALQYGFCNAQLDDYAAVLRHLNCDATSMKVYEPEWIESLILLLIQPAVSGFLLLLIFGGIYFEFKAPGTLFPIAVSVTAALLYFAPLYLQGLALHWEIGLFVAGLGLLLIELFLIPGFGFTGISGIVLMLSALLLAMLRNIDFDFSYESSGHVSLAFALVSAGMVIPLMLLLLFGNKILASSFFKRVSLEASLDSGMQPETIQTAQPEFAETVTDLRPVGKIRYQNQLHSAISMGAFIGKHQTVRIVSRRGPEFIVEALEP